MTTPRDGSDRPEDQPADGDQSRAWEPPGWSLPPAEPDRSQQPATPPAQQPAPPEQDWEATPPPPQQPAAWDQPQQPEPWDQPQQPPVQEEPRRGGLFGGLFGGGRNRPPVDRPPRKPTALEEVYRPREAGTWMDTQAWGAAHGWTPSDGTGPQDAPLVALTRSAPVRPAKSEVPSNVLRGRDAGLDLVAFDIVSPVGQAWVATHAVTAAPVLGGAPAFRLTPARFWRHGTGGQLQIPSGDPEFDQRWVLLVPEDGPQVRRLVEDPVVRQALLGSDDGDELWSAEGFVAAVRPDGNRPLLIQHHARILAAVTAALASAY